MGTVLRLRPASKCRLSAMQNSAEFSTQSVQNATHSLHTALQRLCAALALRRKVVFVRAAHSRPAGCSLERTLASAPWLHARPAPLAALRSFGQTFATVARNYNAPTLLLGLGGALCPLAHQQLLPPAACPAATPTGAPNRQTISTIGPPPPAPSGKPRRPDAKPSRLAAPPASSAHQHHRECHLRRPSGRSCATKPTD